MPVLSSETARAIGSHSRISVGSTPIKTLEIIDGSFEFLRRGFGIAPGGIDICVTENISGRDNIPMSDERGGNGVPKRVGRDRCSFRGCQIRTIDHPGNNIIVKW